MNESTNSKIKNNNAEALAKQQRSHTLLVFCKAAEIKSEIFLNWFKTDCLQTVTGFNKVISGRHYHEYPFNHTGNLKPIGFDYLGIYQLQLDSAEDSGELINQINTLYRNEPSAGDIATWLYFPVSEKVGCNSATILPSTPIITIAFGNAVKGREDEFREWYTTEHLRHALLVPALISSQRFELTGLQNPGSMTPDYQTIAIYEQDDTPENMIKGMALIDPAKVPKVWWSPSGDLERFTEWAYQALTDNTEI